MHLSLDGFVAGPNGEMNRIKVDEEIFDHVGKRISRKEAKGQRRKGFSWRLNNLSAFPSARGLAPQPVQNK